MVAVANPDDPSIQLMRSFVSKARQFKNRTEEHTLQGVNPGGYYHAVWCRDASYIGVGFTQEIPMSFTTDLLCMVSSDRVW
jgi:hypothetical protein